MLKKEMKNFDEMKEKIILCLLCFGKDHAIEAKISEGLSSAVIERGYHPINGVVPIDPRSEVKRLIDMFGDKIAGIAIQPYRPNRELAELLLTTPVKNIPHIIIGHYYYHLQINACVVDNYGGMYAATKHLINCGRKQFAFLGEISLSSTEHERFLGFSDACLHNGIRVNPEFIINKYFETDLRNSLKAIFSSKEPPDALVCLYDGLATRVLRVLKDLKISIPEQAAVISFGDDEDVAEKCDPPLSTAHHPAKEMGAVAAHQLINQIEGKISATPSVFVLPVGLHIRESSGTLSDLLLNGKEFWKVPFSDFSGVKITLEEAVK